MKRGTDTLASANDSKHLSRRCTAGQPAGALFEHTGGLFSDTAGMFSQLPRPDSQHISECLICAEGGVLVLCDRCARSYHEACIPARDPGGGSGGSGAAGKKGKGGSSKQAAAAAAAGSLSSLDSWVCPACLDHVGPRGAGMVDEGPSASTDKAQAEVELALTRKGAVPPNHFLSMFASRLSRIRYLRAACEEAGVLPASRYSRIVTQAFAPEQVVYQLQTILDSEAGGPGRGKGGGAGRGRGRGGGAAAAAGGGEKGGGGRRGKLTAACC